MFELCGPDDFDEFIRRLTFCIVIGNEDAHLKNWSLWYPDRVQARLSPAYDLVSMCVYPDLNRGMSLRLFGDGDPRSVRIESLRHLASSVGGSADRIEAVVHETLERIRVAWSQIGGELPLSPEFVGRLSRYQQSLPLCGGVSMLNS